MPLPSLRLQQVIAHRAVSVIARIPSEPQPSEIFQDLIASPRFDAWGIEIFDAQQQLTLLGSCRQPSQQKSPRIAKVLSPGGAWCKATDHPLNPLPLTLSIIRWIW
jgi:hypothetical protein